MENNTFEGIKQIHKQLASANHLHGNGHGLSHLMRKSHKNMAFLLWISMDFPSP